MKKTNKKQNFQKGTILIIVALIGFIVAMLVIALMPLASSKAKAARMWSTSTRALYAADSGLNDAIWAMNNYDNLGDWIGGGWTEIASNQYRIVERDLNNSAGNTVALYTVDVDLDDPDGDPTTDDAEVDSTGFAPDSNGKERSITADLTRMTAVPDPTQIEHIIEATGDIDINVAPPTGYVGPTTEENSGTVNFEDVFGLSKHDMRRAAGSIVDPPNNPEVSETTWFRLESNSNVRITSGAWNGSGILIVEGDLTITGGTFNGIIWVDGDLDVSGNAVVNGAVFVEGEAEFTGTPNFGYNQDEIDDALDFSYPPLPYEINSWREF